VPLAFESLSHGAIAFGFFNIESDILLLDRYFLFAENFCNYLKTMAKNAADEPYQSDWTIHFVESIDAIGDLTGAIHGARYTGFIGELYRHFPFPRQQEDFKQKPEGYQTQSLVLEILKKYAQPRKISVAISPENDNLQIGDYRFSQMQFQELIKYVWRGGYPRWKDEIRPDYVRAMKDFILQNPKGIFNNIVFEDS
jgi:hypothetical protein